MLMSTKMLGATKKGLATNASMEGKTVVGPRDPSWLGTPQGQRSVEEALSAQFIRPLKNGINNIISGTTGC